MARITNSKTITVRTGIDWEEKFNFIKDGNIIPENVEDYYFYGVLKESHGSTVKLLDIRFKKDDTDLSNTTEIAFLTQNDTVTLHDNHILRGVYDIIAVSKTSNDAFTVLEGSVNIKRMLSAVPSLISYPSTDIDLFIDQGSDWNGVFSYREPGGEVVIPLTDHTAKLQIREFVDSTTVVYEKTQADAELIIDELGGTVTIKILGADTATWDRTEYVYQIEIYDSQGAPTRLVGGSIFLDKEVVR